MVRRSLPISAIPQPGEVLESWLGTLAARLDMTFGEFLFGVGSSIGGIDLRRPGLSVYLTNLEAAAGAASTGVETALLHARSSARSGWRISRTKPRSTGFHADQRSRLADASIETGCPS